MMLGKFLTRRSPSKSILNFEDNVTSLSEIVPFRTSHTSSKLFSDKMLCQKDELGSKTLLEKSESTEYVNVQDTSDDTSSEESGSTAEDRKPKSRSSSFHRLVELMLNKSLEKQIQAPEDTQDQILPKVTQLHAALEKQIQRLNELIQQKIIHTTKILDYPLAFTPSENKDFIDDPVGFSDALCFVISLATKQLAQAIQSKSLLLSKHDVNNLRKRFYKLTASIESLRKTRVKIFTNLNKQIVSPLEQMIFINDYDIDGDKHFSLPILNRIKWGHVSEIPDTDHSFENQFWGNYSLILESLKHNFHLREAQLVPHGEMEVRWNVTSRDRIDCRLGVDNKTFQMSDLDIRTHLRILSDMIELAQANVSNAEKCLKQASSDLQTGKKILGDFSKNISISNLTAIEINEILKVLRVSVATSSTFLKSIEKTTRVSRFFISEGIHLLRTSLGQTKNSKKLQYNYKPKYRDLTLLIKCGPGILPLLEEVKSMMESYPNRYEDTSKFIIASEDSPEVQVVKPLDEPGRAAKSEFEVFPPEVIQDQETVKESENNQTKEFITRIGRELKEDDSKSNATTVPLHPCYYSSFMTAKEEEFQTEFYQETERINSLLLDRLHQAYNILYLPNAAVQGNDTEMSKVPFILGLCATLAKVTVMVQPFKDLPHTTQKSIQKSFKEINQLLFVHKGKKDIFKKLANCLSINGDELKMISSLLLVNPNKLRETAGDSNENLEEMYPDSAFLAEDEARKRKAGIWKLKWNYLEGDPREGLFLKNAATNWLENFANFPLRSKAKILIAHLEFTEFVFRLAEINLKGAETNCKEVDQSLKKMYKRLDKHLKHHTLGQREQQYFGSLVAKLKRTHAYVALLLGKMNLSLIHVISIMFEITSYIEIQRMVVDANQRLFEKRQINAGRILDKKLKDTEKYVNSLLTLSLEICLPIKIDPHNI